MHLKDLKQKSPAELVAMAEELGVESASTLRKQELMFSILKVQAENGQEIMGMGTIEVLTDGFGFLRSPEANYLAGPDDIYVSPNQVRKFGLRTGDTVEGEIRGPKDGERYFALTRLAKVNYDDPAPRQLRQSDAALSGREADAGQRRSDAKGQVGTRHRHRFPPR
jgi:transcription termination factor Rho